MSDQKSYVVYVATNISNGERYVGCTSVGLERRSRAHFSKSASRNEIGCPKFYEAIRKFGRESFSWHVLATFDNSSEAFAEEIRQISDLRPEYNVTSGGKGTPGIASWNRRPVTCLEDGMMFVSATHAAQHYGVTVATITEACSGINRTAAGGRHLIYGDVEYPPEKRKELIRRIDREKAKSRRRSPSIKSRHSPSSPTHDALGRSMRGPLKLAKRVICLDDGLEFPSASAAGRHYGIAYNAISGVCTGKNGRKTASCLRFAYMDKD